MKFLNYLILLCTLIALGACSDNDDDKVEAASLVVDNTELSFTGYQSTIAIKVDATRRWSAVASDWWISVTPDGYPSAGQHFVVNVAVTVSDNDTETSRDGYVKFYLGDDEYATVNVHQDIQNEEDRPEEEYPITWANLQWAAATAIAEGTYFEAGCCVYANGITNAMESTTGEDIVAQIGYSTEDSRPDGDDWTWFDCWFNGDWGDNFYYQGKIEEELSEGIYYYTFRVRNGSGDWKYAGTNGLWDGVDNVSGTFEVLPGSGEQNYDGLEITWAKLQWWASETISYGQYFEAGALVFIDGLTNADTPSVDGNGIVGEIGFGFTDDPHNEDWVWNQGWFNGDWGDNLYYQATTPEMLQTGTFYWSFRFKMGEDGEWAYAGTEGLWDGESNVCGTFNVN